MSDGAGCGTTTRPSASEASSSFEFWSPEDTQRIRDQAKTMRAEARLPLPTDNAPPFPGWAYLRVGRGEKELTVMVRQHGARWIPQGQVWRLRADLVGELGLRNRVVDWGPGAGEHAAQID